MVGWCVEPVSHEPLLWETSSEKGVKGSWEDAEHTPNHQLAFHRHLAKTDFLQAHLSLSWLLDPHDKQQLPHKLLPVSTQDHVPVIYQLEPFKVHTGCSKREFCCCGSWEPKFQVVSRTNVFYGKWLENFQLSHQGCMGEEDDKIDKPPIRQCFNKTFGETFRGFWFRQVSRKNQATVTWRIIPGLVSSLDHHQFISHEWHMNGHLEGELNNPQWGDLMYSPIIR